MQHLFLRNSYQVCSNGDKNEEEKEENNLETGGALGLRTDISNLCLDSQVLLIPVLIVIVINALLLTQPSSFYTMIQILDPDP